MPTRAGVCHLDWKDSGVTAGNSYRGQGIQGGVTQQEVICPWVSFLWTHSNLPGVLEQISPHQFLWGLDNSARNRRTEPLERGATKHYSGVGMGLGTRSQESVEHATTEGRNKENEKQAKHFLLHKPLAQPGASTLHVAKNTPSHLSPTRGNTKLLRAESSGGCSWLHRRHKLFQTVWTVRCVHWHTPPIPALGQ